MLQFLRIENLALLEAVSLEFEEGFTAVTGETGAGKSVLLGALSLLSGNRADKSLLRKGAEQCRIEAALDVRGRERLHRHLEEMGLPSCEEGQLLLRRIVPREKPSRVFINGTLATLAQLQELGRYWIDFHGPGEPQKLFHESEQLALLDQFAGLREEVAAYREGYHAWRETLRAMEDLRDGPRLSADEAAFLRTQIEEIDRLALSAERIEELETAWNRMSHGQERREEAAALQAAFEEEDGIAARLQQLLPRVRRLAEIDGETAALADRLESLLIEANDLGGEFSAIAGEDDLDPESLAQVEADMESWMSLQRKYGHGVEAVLAKRAEMAGRLEGQGDVEGKISELEKQAAVAEKQLRELASALREKRHKAAKKLVRGAEKLLRDLGFKQPRLDMEIRSTRELGPHGDTACRLTFQPNPGEDAQPLNRIASSGEMARVMLALKSVFADSDATPVLVFDEVDANIGGEVATAVARLLAGLSATHQVFCIT
ncbi:MAG: DNA repair protein RecN, partial [Verrucomicrobia bacterium]|nr:DNA repair protein RecN [Verrucomicrobiota bacterium]